MQSRNRVIRWSVLLAGCLGMGTGDAFSHAPNASDYFTYYPQDSQGYALTTNDETLPAKLYLESRYGIREIVPAQSLPSNVAAKIVFPGGKTTEILQAGDGIGGGSRPLQDSLPLIQDDCVDLAEKTFPYVFTDTDLPYVQSFNTTLAVSNGDFLGSAADSISSPGGHDGFWLFKPSQSGKYAFVLYATKGSSTPIPDHEFTRGFGGIGVWQGVCGQPLTEIDTANSILGDSSMVVELEAGQEYYVIWEDHFIGSVENSVRLSVYNVGAPVGNSISQAVSLVAQSWEPGFEVEVNTVANEDLEDAFCIEVVEGEGGHGDGVNPGPETWFRLPATTPGGLYRLETKAGTGILPISDTVMAVYAYNLATHEVAPVECNDDAVEGVSTSLVTFQAEASKLYYVLLEAGSTDGSTVGDFKLAGQGAAQPSSVSVWMMME